MSDLRHALDSGHFQSRIQRIRQSLRIRYSLPLVNADENGRVASPREHENSFPELPACGVKLADKMYPALAWGTPKAFAARGVAMKLQTTIR
jgi:hypothetical protein